MITQNLLEIQWYQVLALVGSGGIAGIVLGIMAWVRFRKKDRADVTVTEADAEVKEATAMKIKAEANQLTKQTDINVADAALKIAESLRIQLTQKDKDLDDTQAEVDKLRKDQWELNQKNIEVSNRCEKLQRDLDKEKEKNRELLSELEQLKLQLEMIKRTQEGGGRPK